MTEGGEIHLSLPQKIKLAIAKGLARKSYPVLNQVDKHPINRLADTLNRESERATKEINPSG